MYIYKYVGVPRCRCRHRENRLYPIILVTSSSTIYPHRAPIGGDNLAILICCFISEAAMAEITNLV